MTGQIIPLRATAPAILPPATVPQLVAELRADGVHARGIPNLCRVAEGYLGLPHGAHPRLAMAALTLAREVFDEAMAAAGITLPPLPEPEIAAACRAVWPQAHDEPVPPAKAAASACRTAANLLETYQFASAHQMLAIATSFTTMAMEAASQ